ncbi:MAG TPA: hypothetical protein VGX76_18515 [Pirellulales bacterium]|nr:hypothetical protein [Pirellulales bacterium]
MTALLLSGCGESANRPESAPQATAAVHEPTGQLKPCPEPLLQPLEAVRQEPAVAAGYPASLTPERLPPQAPPPTTRTASELLPAVTRPFPDSQPQAPLPIATLPSSIIRGVRAVHDGNTTDGPALVAPDSGAPADGQAPPPVEAGHEAPRSQPIHPTRPATERAMVRPREMDAVARQAEAHVRRGYDLAARGALYSARAEFVLALRVITQALDAAGGNRERSQELAAGLAALEEAEDFIPLGSRLEADLDIGILISAHRTPVLKQAVSANLLPLVALQRYYTYAQEQLGHAAGHEEAGSMALYGLGRVYGTMADNQFPNVVAPEPKAMVFHQAALETHAGNFMAANELAVLWARFGRYETARELLRNAVSIASHSALWQNLAIVHRTLGETQLAVLAENEAALADQREKAAAQAGKLVPSSDVRWVDAATFAGTSKPATELQRPPAAPAGQAAAPAAAQPTANRGWWPLGALKPSQGPSGPLRR